MADAPNQKVLLAGFAVAFLAVALVLFLMLRGGTDEAAAPANTTPPAPGATRPAYKAPPNMKPNQVQRYIDLPPPSPAN